MDQQEPEEQDGDQKAAEFVLKSHRKKVGKINPEGQDGTESGEKLIDFCNRAKRRRMAKSIVGTSQYMAPEVICGGKYDGRCD